MYPAPQFLINKRKLVLAPAFSGGAGDVVSGAKAWWGLRAYNTAYATGSNPALDLHNDATGTFVATINILATGALDVTTANIIITGGASKVGKLYDQTGNAWHLTQATNANRPALTLSGLGSLPILTFDGSNDTLSNATSFVQGNPATYSAVANSTNNAAQQCLFYNNTQQLGYNNSGANTVFVYNGAVLNRAATDGSWHALQGVFGTTSANSEMNVDGTSTTGDAGTGTTGAATFFLGTSNGTSQPFSGKFVEGGYWELAFTGTNSTNMSSNQHTYWGF